MLNKNIRKILFVLSKSTIRLNREIEIAKLSTIRGNFIKKYFWGNA